MTGLFTDRTKQKFLHQNLQPCGVMSPNLVLSFSAIIVLYMKHLLFVSRYVEPFRRRASVWQFVWKFIALLTLGLTLA